MKDHMTGGGETLEMIDDLMEGLIELFIFSGTKVKCKVSQADLEDMLFDFTSRELNTNLEDGSVEQIADYAMRLFHSLNVNDLSFYEKLTTAAEKRNKAKPKVQDKTKKKKSPVYRLPEDGEEMQEEKLIEDEDDGSWESGEGGEEEEEEEEGNEGGRNNSNNKVEDDEWTVVTSTKKKAK